MTNTNQDKISMRDLLEGHIYSVIRIYDLAIKEGRNLEEVKIALITQNTDRLLDLFESELKSLREELEKYQCNFNWDFEKNTAKHKSYIALDDVLKLIDERMGK